MSNGVLIVQVAVNAAGENVRPRQPASAALKHAALMLTARLYHRGDAPLGIQGGFDFGGLHIRSRDPDISALMRGRRGREFSEAQEWPTVDDVRTRARIGSSVADDEIQAALDAVIDHMKTHETFGIA